MKTTKSTILWIAMSFVFAGAAIAQDLPTTGLGQAWPATTDVSLNSHYHVYLFGRSGVRYIQINDTQGNVLAAVALGTSSGLVLPLGSAANNVTIVSASTPSNSLKSSAAIRMSTPAPSSTLYQDSTTTLTATPQSNGQVKYMVIGKCDDPLNCIGGRLN